MTKLKALSKVFLALACLFFYSAYNTAHAQETYEDPAMAQTVEPTPTYSPDNPFATSEYTDLANIAEDWLQLGGNIDQYFYSEGFTTGTDGELGNEYLCIRDDFNKVYVGRSDVCVDRQAADYEYIHFDQINLDGFDSLAQLRNSMLDPDQIYKTGDLLGNTSQYWDGCYTINQGWGGTSGGSCPTINDQYSGQINFGYVNQTLTNTAAIDQALKGVGLETTGYTYIWKVKNADANYEDRNNPDSVDPFEVTVKIYDNNGNSIYEKTYDYSRWIDDWTRFMGTETFDEPFNLDEISELQLSITGYDIGYWAGYYGPEFREPNINLLYRVAEPTGPSPEEILKEQMCISDPTSDPTCPGYNDAMIAQIASTNTIDDINSGADIGAAINDGSTGEFDDTTGTTEQIADTTGAIIDDGADTGSDNGAPDPVAEATGEPDPVAETIEESVAEATPDPVQEAVEEATEEAVAEADATKDPASASTGLNATQLSALDAANNVANSAVAAATGTAQASAGIGLSESGGVSSTLTSVDPTDSTRTDGGVLGGTDFEFSSDVAASDPTQSTETTQTAGINNNQSFGSTQTNTSQSVSGSDDGSSQGTQSNNGSSNNFGTTDLASLSGDNTQDSNPLAAGSAVETNDITGEQALSTSNEAITQLAMLNDPTNPINQIINDITANMITQAVADAEETAEESAEASVESQNAQEDALVAEALAGSDDEDAQAALLGYNPNFRAYQQPQMPGGDIYNDQGVYENQKTYDNPRAGLFNGASDQLHRDMVRQQYEK